MTMMMMMMIGMITAGTATVDVGVPTSAASVNDFVVSVVNCVVLTVTTVHQHKRNNTGWSKKTGPDNFCNNFVYCHPIFIIFGTYTLQEICNRRMYT